MSRKRSRVSLETKMEALQRLDSGESLKSVAACLGVSYVAVTDWRRRRNEIETYVQAAKSSSGLARKSMRRGDYELTAKALYLWYCQMKGMGVSVSRTMLQDKAKEFQERLKEGEDNFSASNTWISTWRSKHDIRPDMSEKTKDSRELAEFQRNLKDIVVQTEMISDDVPTVAPITNDQLKQWFSEEFQLELIDDAIIKTVVDDAINKTIIHPGNRPCREETETCEVPQDTNTAPQREESSPHSEDMVPQPEVVMTHKEEYTTASRLKISHANGVKAIETALAYIEQQDDTTSHDVLSLQRLLITALKKSKSPKSIVKKNQKQLSRK